MAGRYVPAPGLAARLTGLVDRKIEAKADLVLRTAQVTAPVDTGRYKASLRKEHPSEGVWIVSANTPYAKYLEFGTRRMRAYRTLGRALDAAR